MNQSSPKVPDDRLTRLGALRQLMRLRRMRRRDRPFRSVDRVRVLELDRRGAGALHRYFLEDEAEVAGVARFEHGEVAALFAIIRVPPDDVLHLVLADC